jgi:hypothetical protein
MRPDLDTWIDRLRATPAPGRLGRRSSSRSRRRRLRRRGSGRLLCSRDKRIRDRKLQADGECADAQQHRENRGRPSHKYSPLYEGPT